MKSRQPYYPAIWFLWGSIVVSIPASWFVSPPQWLSPYQLAHFGAILRSASIAGSFAGFLGYAMSLAVLRAFPMRRKSMALGAVAGVSIVVMDLPKFISMNFWPVCLGLLVLGVIAGIPVGLRARVDIRASKAGN